MNSAILPKARSKLLSTKVAVSRERLSIEKRHALLMRNALMRIGDGIIAVMSTPLAQADYARIVTYARITKTRGLLTADKIKNDLFFLIEAWFTRYQTFFPTTEYFQHILKDAHDEGYAYGVKTGNEALGFSVLVKAVEPNFEFFLTDAEILATFEVRRRFFAKKMVDTMVYDGMYKVRDRIFAGEDDFRDIVESLETIYGDPVRALRIARTEVHTAISDARDNVFMRSGVEKRRWVTVGDDRVRPQHLANEDQGLVPYGQPFQSGVDSPGGEVNCRCVVEPDLSDPSLILEPWTGDGAPF